MNKGTQFYGIFVTVKNSAGSDQEVLHSTYYTPEWAISMAERLNEPNFRVGSVEVEGLPY